MEYLLKAKIAYEWLLVLVSWNHLTVFKNLLKNTYTIMLKCKYECT